MSMGFSTDAVHAGQDPDPRTGAVTSPLYQTSTYQQEALGKPRLGFEYARTQNPTRAALETNLATLEGGKHALAFASGLAAISTILQLLQAGDHVVCTENVYGGTYRLADRVWHRFGLEFSFVDTSVPEQVERAMHERTRLLFVESPTNPILTLSDLAALSRLAHARGVSLVVDITFMTPFFQRPFNFRYGKINLKYEFCPTASFSSRPSPMKALTAGFDATSRHLILVIFSVVLDLFLWLGPRLRMDAILAAAIQQIQSIPNVGSPEVFQILHTTAQELNFFSVIRTYPVGVPSLVAARLSADTPAGQALGWEIPSTSLAAALWLLLTFVGITVGTLFFTLVAQSAVDGKINWKIAFYQLPRASLQICLLAITCFFLVLAAFLPFSCLLAILHGESRD